MRHDLCEFESAFNGPVAGHVGNPALVHHLQGCESCRDAATASSFMRLQARELMMSERPLPGASQIWELARISDRERSAKLVLRPLELASLIAAAVLSLIAALWVGARWQAAVHAFTAMKERSTEALWFVQGDLSQTVPIVSVATVLTFVMFCVAVGVTAHSVLIEE